jgi:Tol biopolymer transport system component
MSANGLEMRRIDLQNAGNLGDTFTAPSLSPDARRAVFETESDASFYHEIWVAALDGSGNHKLRVGEGPRWSPDGRTIAFTTVGGRLKLLDASTERLLLTRRFGRPVESLDWSPDGRRLLLVMGEGHSSLATLRVVRPANRIRRITLSRGLPGGWQLDRAVWSPDGHRIALTAYRLVGYEAVRMSVWIVSAGGDHLHRLLKGGVTGDGLLPDTLSWQPTP